MAPLSLTQCSSAVRVPLASRQAQKNAAVAPVRPVSRAAGTSAAAARIGSQKAAFAGSRGALMAAAMHPRLVARKMQGTRCDASSATPSEGRPNALWRVLACLPYLVPFMGSLSFGMDLFDVYPAMSWLITVFGPMLQAYYSNQFTPFFVFFAMFLLVVRNEKLPHFVRFNAMQSILLDICVMLSGLIIQYLPFELAFSWIGAALNNITFMTGTAGVFYAIWYTLQGKYADIPTVSEAVYIQVRN